MILFDWGKLRLLSVASQFHQMLVLWTKTDSLENLAVVCDCGKSSFELSG